MKYHIEDLDCYVETGIKPQATFDLNIPEHMDPLTVEWWDSVRDHFRNVNNSCRGRIFHVYGRVIWEEPIEDYNKRIGGDE